MQTGSPAAAILAGARGAAKHAGTSAGAEVFWLGAAGPGGQECDAAREFRRAPTRAAPAVPATTPPMKHVSLFHTSLALVVAHAAAANRPANFRFEDHAAPPADVPIAAAEAPLFRSIDLNVGESGELILADGSRATLKVLELVEETDDVRGAVRQSRVKVAVNGTETTLRCLAYQLPITIGGVQIDCPVTQGFNVRTRRAVWGLEKAVRLRVWPAGSPWMPPGKFMYPARQRWFATHTQMSTEPSYVDGGENADTSLRIYYHWGLDIGGSEGLVEVVAATDAVVVSLGTDIQPGEERSPAEPRYDVIYLRDARNWYYRYSHLKSFDPDVKLGGKVRMGQRIGWLGKEGGSGGWSHLHFDITGRQHSGRWGIVDGYAFLWEAYHREHPLTLTAVARPHALAWAGHDVTLDGSRSRTASAGIRGYEWTFSGGGTATGALVTRRYDRPGIYSEILKVTDAAGRVDYDFASVQVLDKANPKALPATINANYAPTFGIKPGTPVTFRVRCFRTGVAASGPPWEGEVWDFGDGTPPVRVKSDGNLRQHAPDGYAETVHRFARAGTYLVKVERAGTDGPPAIARLKVVVE